MYKMEIDDSCFPHLAGVTATTDCGIAFAAADVVVILGGFPRAPGMLRKELIGKNAIGMQAQSVAINTFASRDVKVLVVANPCNTNCLVCIASAPDIPPQNFSCLTRLDQERLRGVLLKELRERLGESESQSLTANCLRNVAIWGNHSNTQVPYFDAALVRLPSKSTGSTNAWTSAM